MSERTRRPIGTVERLEQARARMERGGAYANDLRIQCGINGGLTDAERYAIKHLEALIGLYQRAGLETENEEKQLEEIRRYVERIKADAASAQGAPNDHARGV